MTSKCRLSETEVAKAINNTGLNPAAVVEALKDGVMITYGDLSVMVTPVALQETRERWMHIKQIDPSFAERMFAVIEPTLADRCRRVMQKHPPPTPEFMDELVEDLKLWHVVTQS